MFEIIDALMRDGRTPERLVYYQLTHEPSAQVSKKLWLRKYLQFYAEKFVYLNLCLSGGLSTDFWLLWI